MALAAARQAPAAVQPASPARRRRCLVAARAAPAAAPAGSVQQQAGALKADVTRLSGSKYGLDLDEPAKAAVVAKVQQLESLGLPVKVSVEGLTGTTWTTVFTTSDGTSSGKVGPFITQVTQVFPQDEPGVYYNSSKLGAVEARLRGDYAASRDDRIDLEFRTLGLYLFGVKVVEKVFEPGATRGFWKLSYLDDDFRCFYTNKQNLFVLRKL